MFKFRSLMFYTSLSSFIMAVLSALVSVYFGDFPFAYGVLSAVVFGILSLFFLSKDLKVLFFGVGAASKGFFIYRFILRLVYFSILLYVLLVVFRFSPVGVVLGFILPIVALGVVSLFFIVNNMEI